MNFLVQLPVPAKQFSFLNKRTLRESFEEITMKNNSYSSVVNGLYRTENTGGRSVRAMQPLVATKAAAYSVVVSGYVKGVYQDSFDARTVAQVYAMDAEVEVRPATEKELRHGVVFFVGDYQFGAETATSFVSAGHQGPVKVLSDSTGKLVAVLPSFEAAKSVACYCCQPHGGYGSVSLVSAPESSITHQSFIDWV